MNLVNTQQFTNALGKVSDEFLLLNWYLFPAKIQRMLPITINNVQKPVVIGSFGTISGSRDQFKKVVQMTLIQTQLHT